MLDVDHSSPITDPLGVRREVGERVCDAPSAARSLHQAGDVDRMLTTERLVGSPAWGRAQPPRQSEHTQRLLWKRGWVLDECDHFEALAAFMLAGLTVREERRSV